MFEVGSLRVDMGNPGINVIVYLSKALTGIDGSNILVFKINKERYTCIK
jgi:hypothetical protein